MTPPSIAPEPLPIAVRAYTEPIEPDKGESPDQRTERLAKLMTHRIKDNHRDVLIFDTETRTDPSQKLMFGVWRYCLWKHNRLVCIEEGMFTADDFPGADQQIVHDYHHDRRLDTGADQGAGQWAESAATLKLCSEREFVKTLYRRCQHRGARSAAIIGLNINFDLTRLAVNWAEPEPMQRRRPFEKRPTGRPAKFGGGGWSIQLHEGYADPADGRQRENSQLFPRYMTKHLASTKALKMFASKFAGHIIDVRTLLFALTNTGYSLESGCDQALGGIQMPGAAQPGYVKRNITHGIVSREMIDYCREDVLATQLLYEKAVREFDKHPIPLQASQAYSPASVGKAYLAGMGITPRMESQPDFDRGQLGISMSTFYGGRTEARIVKTPVPVAYCDLLSAYTTANSLMNLWPLVIADEVQMIDATSDVQHLVEMTDLAAVLQPETWLKMAALVQIEPDGDVLPVRAKYDGAGYNIGSNPLWSSEPLWYALPDVIASKLLTGRSPRIVQALRLVPIGVQDGLKSMKMRGQVKVDPRENFFRTVIEQRHELPDETHPMTGKRIPGPKTDTGEFLKTLANAASYGIYAEVVRDELPEGRTRRVLVSDRAGQPFQIDTRAPERPGPFFFSPMAALITAGTRLLLATVERMVTDAGGAWALMDTDSIAIVSSKHGGLVPCPGGEHTDKGGGECVQALSWAQVDDIRSRMGALNPYGGKAGTKPILELEGENYDRVTGERRPLYCYAISSKRYVLFNLDAQGRPQLRKGVDPERHAHDENERSTIRKHSQHALGYLLNPIDPDSSDRDWIRQGWEWVLADALGLPVTQPAWFDRPALMRSSVTKPRILRNFNRYNERKAKRDQIRPFNFAMVARPAQGFITSLGRQVALIAPYESNSALWTRLVWVNHYNPDDPIERHITTDPMEATESPENTEILVQSMRDVFQSYRDHPEHKSLGTIGRLARRPVTDDVIVSVGKEINEFEEQLSGIRQTEDEHYNTYHQPDNDDEDDLVLAIRVLDALGITATKIASRFAISTDTLTRARSGKSVTPAHRHLLIEQASGRAGVALRNIGLPRTGTPAEILNRYLKHIEGRPCQREGCENPIPPRRKKFCSRQ